MTFQVGQKVVCVDDSPGELGPTSVKRGSIYTVSRVYLDSGQIGICLAEAKPCHALLGFWARRFRPIVSRKTDISIFKRMLTPTGVDA